jgi:ribosome-associated protein
VTLLDVRDLSQVCDYVLIASGTSERQMKSVAAELEDLGPDYDNPCFRSNKDSGATWIVIDFIELVAHLFEPSQRAYYELEELWSDAPHVDWQGNGKSNGEADGRDRSSASGD